MFNPRSEIPSIKTDLWSDTTFHSQEVNLQTEEKGLKLFASCMHAYVRTLQLERVEGKKVMLMAPSKTKFMINIAKQAGL
jgi:hypothetical protein